MAPEHFGNPSIKSHDVELLRKISPHGTIYIYIYICIYIYTAMSYFDLLNIGMIRPAHRATWAWEESWLARLAQGAWGGFHQ